MRVRTHRSATCCSRTCSCASGAQREPVRIARLQLQNFRNYRSADIRFDDGSTVLVGRNGQGKTNLVEAVAYLSTLSSHRVSTDAALVRSGEDTAIVRGELRHGDRSVDIDVAIAKSGSNTARVNGRTVRARDLPRYMASVVFAPEDLTLVRGEPATRRALLDAMLATGSVGLSATLADYERVVRQRNALLKASRNRAAELASSGALDVWDERLIDLGSIITAERIRLVGELSPLLGTAYEQIAGSEQEAGMSMRISALAERASVMGDGEDADGPDARGGDITIDELRERFAERLQEVRGKELERGLSLVGPHRDDAVFWLNGLPARVTASHGESWSFALALKLAAARLLREQSKAGDPIIILDDVFAELDARRRTRLAGAISGFEQVLITAAVAEDVPEELSGQMIAIEAGTVRQGGPADADGASDE